MVFSNRFRLPFWEPGLKKERKEKNKKKNKKKTKNCSLGNFKNLFFYPVPSEIIFLFPPRGGGKTVVLYTPVQFRNNKDKFSIPKHIPRYLLSLGLLVPYALYLFSPHMIEGNYKYPRHLTPTAGSRSSKSVK